MSVLSPNSPEFYVLDKREYPYFEPWGLLLRRPRPTSRMDWLNLPGNSGVFVGFVAITVPSWGGARWRDGRSSHLRCFTEEYSISNSWHPELRPAEKALRVPHRQSGPGIFVVASNGVWSTYTYVSEFVYIYTFTVSIELIYASVWLYQRRTAMLMHSHPRGFSTIFNSTGTPLSTRAVYTSERFESERRGKYNWWMHITISCAISPKKYTCIWLSGRKRASGPVPEDDKSQGGDPQFALEDFGTLLIAHMSVPHPFL